MPRCVYSHHPPAGCRPPGRLINVTHSNTSECGQPKHIRFARKIGTPFNVFCSPKGVEISCIVLPKHSIFAEHFGNQTSKLLLTSFDSTTSHSHSLLKVMSSSATGAPRASLYRQYSRGSSGGASSSSIENLPPRTLSRVAREVRDLIKSPPEGIRLVLDNETGLPANLGEIVVSEGVRK